MKIKNGFEFGFMFACGAITYISIISFIVIKLLGY